MSERGSFVTEYINCPECLEAAKNVLCQRDKFLCAATIPSWEGDGIELPIVAGKIGGRGSGDELIAFDQEYIPALAKLVCHTIRISVLADNGQSHLFYVVPDASGYTRAT